MRRTDRAGGRTPGLHHVWAAGRTLLIGTAGWILVLLGLAALVLPGPGLLLLVSGLALLSLRYRWAQRLLRPVEAEAVHLARLSVTSWPRLVVAIGGALGLVAAGVVWGIGPPAPQWWRWPAEWWLIGGWGTGATLIASGGFALGLIAYSFRRFRGAARGG